MDRPVAPLADAASDGHRHPGGGEERDIDVLQEPAQAAYVGRVVRAYIDQIQRSLAREALKLLAARAFAGAGPLIFRRGRLAARNDLGQAGRAGQGAIIQRPQFGEDAHRRNGHLGQHVLQIQGFGAADRDQVATARQHALLDRKILTADPALAVNRLLERLNIQRFTDHRRVFQAQGFDQRPVDDVVQQNDVRRPLAQVFDEGEVDVIAGDGRCIPAHGELRVSTALLLAKHIGRQPPLAGEEHAFQVDARKPLADLSRPLLQFVPLDLDVAHERHHRDAIARSLQISQLAMHDDRGAVTQDQRFAVDDAKDSGRRDGQRGGFLDGRDQRLHEVFAARPRHEVRRDLLRSSLQPGEVVDGRYDGGAEFGVLPEQDGVIFVDLGLHPRPARGHHRLAGGHRLDQHARAPRAVALRLVGREHDVGVRQPGIVGLGRHRAIDQLDHIGRILAELLHGLEHPRLAPFTVEVGLQNQARTPGLQVIFPKMGGRRGKKSEILFDPGVAQIGDHQRFPRRLPLRQARLEMVVGEGNRQRREGQLRKALIGRGEQIRIGVELYDPPQEGRGLDALKQAPVVLEIVLEDLRVISQEHVVGGVAPARRQLDEVAQQSAQLGEAQRAEENMIPLDRRRRGDGAAEIIGDVSRGPLPEPHMLGFRPGMLEGG